jgi:hypothetical protein
MYDSATGTLAATGATFSAAALIWWPLAIFAILAVGIALVRMGVVRTQIQP